MRRLSSPTAPPPRSFQWRFCRHFNLPNAGYDDAMLRLTLYPHARWTGSVSPSRLRTLDQAFVTAVGRLQRPRDLADAVQEYQDDERNHSFWRRTTRLRISVRRLRLVFHAVWSDSR